MRLFSENTPWDLARRSLRYLCAGLAAAEEHGDLCKPLRGHLAKWKALEAEREDAEDALVEANARVRWLDRVLDTHVDDLASRLTYELGRNTAHPTFRKYFPESPTAVVKLGLESEIDRTRAFDVVAEELGASKEIRAILKDMEATRKLGAAALSEREKIAETQGRVSLRIQSWKESANDALRSIHIALETYAVKNGKPRGYADEFFLSPVAPRKSTKRPPTSPDPSAPSPQ